MESNCSYRCSKRSSRSCNSNGKSKNRSKSCCLLLKQCYSTKYNTMAAMLSPRAMWPFCVAAAVFPFASSVFAW